VRAILEIGGYALRARVFSFVFASRVAPVPRSRGLIFAAIYSLGAPPLAHLWPPAYPC
jgi:hypothetical protein